jgi:hypothetical protein
LLKFENVTKKTDSAVFSDFSFEIPESGVYAVIGKKGREWDPYEFRGGLLESGFRQVFIADQNAYENAVATDVRFSICSKSTVFSRR